MYAVAVSYLEWIRWIATGWFRCSDRIVWLEGPDDQQGFDELMDRTPDLQVTDDQGYLIACLLPDAFVSDRHHGNLRTPGHTWIKVSAVSSFNPLSIRGARLLEADAERASVLLGPPLFEGVWTNWRDRRVEDEAHWRGLNLCNAFGFLSPKFDGLNSTAFDVLIDRMPAPNANDVREAALDGTRAVGWVLAMSVAVYEPTVKTAFKDSAVNGKIKSLIKILRNDFDLSRPLLDGDALLLSREIDSYLLSLGSQITPLEIMATTLHYKHATKSARGVCLDALISDLTTIAMTNPDHASLVTYFVGRSMENVAVTTLLYRSDPERYKALVPAKKVMNTNIMKISASLLDVSNPSDFIIIESEVDSVQNENSSINEVNPKKTNTTIKNELNVSEVSQENNDFPIDINSNSVNSSGAEIIAIEKSKDSSNIASEEGFNADKLMSNSIKTDMFEEDINSDELVPKSEKPKRKRKK